MCGFSNEGAQEKDAMPDLTNREERMYNTEHA